MTHHESKDLLDQLGELRRLFPEMRFGQLIANLAVVARGTEPGAIWEMEDEELMAAALWQLEQVSGPSSELASLSRQAEF